MSEFNKGNWAARFGAMGDKAEAAFEAICPNHHRSGINRPPLNVAQLSVKDRNTPDYLTNDGYVECMGIGGKVPSLKLKVEKAIALCMWNHDTPTDLFVWDSTRRRWWRAPIWQWINACVLHGQVHKFHDNDKPYWQLTPDQFPVGPTKMIEGEAMTKATNV